MKNLYRALRFCGTLFCSRNKIKNKVLPFRLPLARTTPTQKSQNFTHIKNFTEHRSSPENGMYTNLQSYKGACPVSSVYTIYTSNALTVYKVSSCFREFYYESRVSRDHAVYKSAAANKQTRSAFRAAVSLKPAVERGKICQRSLSGCSASTSLRAL